MISAILPAYNEQDRIATTIGALNRVPSIDEIVVVDDGSTDETASYAERAGARVVRLARNSGKGAALVQGIAAAHGQILLFLDADLAESAEEAHKLLAPLLHDEADMAIALFPERPGRGGGLGFVVKAARKGIHRATGRWMKAPLSGQRALRRAVLDRIPGIAGGFGVEVALTVDALRAGFRVMEVPTEMDHRVTGRNWRGFLHRGRQWVAVIRVLASRRIWPC